jgi:transposase
VSIFEDFIEHLLPLLGKWTEDRSVLVMDNASFHHSQRVKGMCNAAGVKLIFLLAYCPHLNPIEEFFAELKAFVKRHWIAYSGTTDRDFSAYLEWCIKRVGRKKNIAMGQFRNAGWSIEDEWLNLFTID